MNGYWKKPALHRSVEGGDLILGPIQINWYGNGLRVHVTWPVCRTLTLHQP